MFRADPTLKARLPQTPLGERALRGFGTEKERKLVVEPKGLSFKDLPGDIADVLGGAPSLGGFLGGAALGAKVGAVGGIPGIAVGGIIGAGLGSGAGEFLRQRVGSLLGMQKEITPKKQLKEIGKEVVAGSTAQVLGGLLGKIAKPVVRKLVKPAVSKLGEVGRDILSITGGVPEQAIATAWKRPLSTRVGFGKDITATTIEKEIKSAAGQISKASKKAFGEGLEKISSQYQHLAIPQKRIVNDTMKTELRGIERDFINTAKQFRITFTKTGVIKGFPVKIESAARKNVKEAYNLIQKQKDFSPKGLQGLVEDLQSLQKYGMKVPIGGMAVTGNTPVVAATNSKVVNLIKRNYPELGNLRTEFAKKAKIMKGVDMVFKVAKEGPTATKSGVAKLTNIFRTDQDIYLETLIQLEKLSGIPFLGRLAGTEFERIMPGLLRSSLAVGGLAAGSWVTSPLLLLSLPLFSPRAIGGMVTRGAQTMGVGKEVGRRLTPLISPTVRSLIKERISE